MQLRDAVLKRSLGRRVLHHLDSTYRVELNEKACTEIDRALEDAAYAGPGRALVDRLMRQGLITEGPHRGLHERSGAELVSMEVEPIGRCNLDCKHCFVTFSRQKMRDACFDAVLAGAVQLGAVELTFNGGEPLLHPQTLDWLERARAAGLRTQLFTNATLINAALALRLAASRVARVTVSLDGFEAEHDALRGRGAFRKTSAGIRAMVRAGVSVFTTTVVHPGNEARLRELEQFCRRDLGVAGVRLSTVAPLGRARQAPALQLPPQKMQALYADEVARAPGESSPPGPLPCHAGVDKLYVSAAGQVYGCHLFEGSPPLGELPGQTLAEVYAAVQHAPSAVALRAFSVERLAACRGCPALAACQGGCRARAQQLTGDLWGPDLVSCQKRGLTPPRVGS